MYHEYFLQFGHYLRCTLGLDIMKYIDIPKEHEHYFPERATPEYQEEREQVLEIYESWKWLIENASTPETRFPFKKDPSCKRYKIKCENCLWNGNCSNFTLYTCRRRSQTTTRNQKKRKLNVNNGPCPTTEQKQLLKAIEKKIDRKLGKKEEKDLMHLQQPGVEKREESGEQQPGAEQQSQPAEPRSIEQQQEVATTSRQAQQMDQIEQQREYLARTTSVNLNGAARSKELNTDSDTASSNQTDDDEELVMVSTYQRVHNSASQSSFASVLITPPVSNEPAVNKLSSGSPTSQFEEVGETGVMKDKPSSCEQILKTKFTNFCLNDHSYYQNQPHNLECLGIQTPSESEDEEIDVVTPYRGAVGQRSAPSNVFQRPEQQTTRVTANTSTVRRPRGRPPTNPNRKRVLQNGQQQSIPKLRRRTPRRSRSTHPSIEQSEQEQIPEQVEAVPPQQPPLPDKPQIPQQRRERQTRQTRQERQERQTRHARRIIQEIQIAQKPQVPQEQLLQIQQEQERRNLHNDMERRRRVDLRNHFEELKSVIPEIADKEKSPKVMILVEAQQYCAALTSQSERQNKDYTKLRVMCEKNRVRFERLKAMHRRGMKFESD